MWRFDLVVEQWQLVSQEHTATSAAARPSRGPLVYTTVVDPGAATGGCDSYLYMFGGATLEDQSLTHATHGDLWSFATARARGATRPTAMACRRSRALALLGVGGAQYAGDHGRWWVFGGLGAGVHLAVRARRARRPLVDRLLGSCEGRSRRRRARPQVALALCAAGRARATMASRRRGRLVDAVKALVGAFPAVVEPCGARRGRRGAAARRAAGGCADRLLFAAGGDRRHFRSRRPRPRAERAWLLGGSRSTDTRLSSSYRLVCTGRAHLAPEGSILCEEGVPTTEANCPAAVKSLVTFTASSRTALQGLEGSTPAYALCRWLLVADGRRPGGVLPGQPRRRRRLDLAASRRSTGCAWRATCRASSPPGCRTTSRCAAA